MQLFPYQEEGAKFLAERRRALLFDAPGVGKTPQAIRAMDLCGDDFFNVVCPASIVTQWNRECRKHATREWPGRAMSYEHARDKGITPEPNSVLTLDECHYLKNRTSGRTKVILGKKPFGLDGEMADARRIWCLSGTPAPKNPMDLYPLMRAVVPGSLTSKVSGKMLDYFQFMEKFCITYDSGHGLRVKRAKNLDELADRLAPYMLRRSKKDVRKDWKEPLRSTLHLSDVHALDALRKVERSPEGELIAQTIETVGVEGLADIAPQCSTLRRYTGMAKVPATVRWLLEAIDDGMGKAVIFAYHREVISELKDQLTQHRVKCEVFWGGMSDKKQAQAIASFQENPKVHFFIGQINACGTGLDGLQKAAGTAIMLERSWIDDENQQAIDRLDRIGQEENVLAQFITLEGSLDEAITLRAEQRAADSSALFD